MLRLCFQCDHCLSGYCHCATVCCCTRVTIVATVFSMRLLSLCYGLLLYTRYYCDHCFFLSPERRHQNVTAVNTRASATADQQSTSTPERHQPPTVNVTTGQHQIVVKHQQSTSPPVNTVSPSKATTDLITLLHASSCRHLMQRQMLKLRNWIVRHLLKNDIVIRVVAPSASVRPDHTTTVTCCTTCFHTVQDYHKNA